MQLLIYDTQVFRVSGGHVTSRCQGLFPPLPTSKGKALGTRLSIKSVVISTFPDQLRSGYKNSMLLILCEHVIDPLRALIFVDPFWAEFTKIEIFSGIFPFTTLPIYTASGPKPCRGNEYFLHVQKGCINGVKCSLRRRFPWRW